MDAGRLHLEGACCARLAGRERAFILSFLIGAPHPTPTPHPTAAESVAGVPAADARIAADAGPLPPRRLGRARPPALGAVNRGLPHALQSAGQRQPGRAAHAAYPNLRPWKCCKRIPSRHRCLVLMPTTERPSGARRVLSFNVNGLRALLSQRLHITLSQFLESLQAGEEVFRLRRATPDAGSAASEKPMSRRYRVPTRNKAAAMRRGARSGRG